MTLDELDEKYPDGLYDAEVTGIAIDYRSRTATVQLNLRASLPDSPKSGEYTPAVLSIQGFSYIAIEAPDSDRLLGWVRQAIQVSAFAEDPKQFPLFEHVKSGLPVGAFICRLFVHDWNSFIHIAARDAELSFAKGVGGVKFGDG